jgi:hypothetical protein
MVFPLYMEMVTYIIIHNFLKIYSETNKIPNINDIIENNIPINIENNIPINNIGKNNTQHSFLNLHLKFNSIECIFQVKVSLIL